MKLIKRVIINNYPESGIYELTDDEMKKYDLRKYLFSLGKIKDKYLDDYLKDEQVVSMIKIHAFECTYDSLKECEKDIRRKFKENKPLFVIVTNN